MNDVVEQRKTTPNYSTKLLKSHGFEASPQGALVL